MVPGIHPFFYISTDAFNHTEEYTEAAGTAARVYWEQMFVSPNEIELHCDQPSTLSRSRGLVSVYPGALCSSSALFLAPGAEKAQLFTLRTAKALAMTAVDVVCCPVLLRQVREDFRLAKLKQEK